MDECSTEEQKIIEDLLQVLDSIISIPSDKKFNLDNSFFEVGGNSLNAITTAISLTDKGYKISKF